MKMFITLAALLLLITTAFGQEFTMESGYVEPTAEYAVDLLIAPYSPLYHISEIDRRLADDDQDEAYVRDRLRTYLMRRLDERFADSLRTLNMLMADTDMVDYLHNGSDIRSTDIEAKTGKEQTGLRVIKARLSKRKEQRVYGGEVVTHQGQLERRDITTDRYMGAHLANQGMVEYLQDSYHHRMILYVTQLELRRDTEPGSSIYGDSDYLLKIHYDLLDEEAQRLTGGRFDLRFSAENATMSELTDGLFTHAADEIYKRLSVYLTTAPDIDKAVTEDY